MSDERSRDAWRVVPFRPERNATVDTLRWAKKRFTVPVLLEVDVTRARAAIREHRRLTGEGLGLTAWVVHCVARAAAENPRVHAVRRGRRRIVEFDEVDVAVLVERTVDDGETLPMPFVVRDAHAKSPGSIDAEIRRAQSADVTAGTSSLEESAPAWLQRLFFRLPTVLRDLVLWRPLLRDPVRVKRTMGTVVVTSTAMASPGVLAWGVPLSVHPLAIGVGGITARGSGDDRSEVLALTVVFDHAVVDGAPVGRFVKRVCELVGEGPHVTTPLEHPM